MGSLKTLTARIRKFYQSVEEHAKQIQECIKNLEKPCNSIINQSLLFRAVIDENSIDKSGFENIPGFKESLTNNIQNSLDVEFNHLKEIREKIYSINEPLCEQQRLIETEYNNLRDKKQIDLSLLNPCCPSLEHVISWCSDIWKYYHFFYIRMCQILIILRYDDEDSVNSLYELMKEDSELKKQIDKIRSFDLSNFEFLVDH